MKLDAQSLIQFWNESVDVRMFASVRHPHIYEIMRKELLRFLLGVHVLRHMDSFHYFSCMHLHFISTAVSIFRAGGILISSVVSKLQNRRKRLHVEANMQNI